MKNKILATFSKFRISALQEFEPSEYEITCAVLVDIGGIGKVLVSHSDLE